MRGACGGGGVAWKIRNYGDDIITDGTLMARIRGTPPSDMTDRPGTGGYGWRYLCQNVCEPKTNFRALTAAK